MSTAKQIAISAARPAKTGLLAAAIVAATYLAAMAGPPQLLADAHAGNTCSAVEVVFARGTGEPDGVGAVGQAFVDALRGDLGGENINVYAVNYAASYNFMKATDGANDAAAYLQNRVATCPNTSFVLGGFSQGAAVIDLITADPTQAFGYAVPMSPEVANHVAAVAVFGNPSQKIGKPLAENSALYGSKTIELCNGADPVCSNGSDRAAHSLYDQAGLPGQAAAFAAQRVGHAAPAAPVLQTSGAA